MSAADATPQDSEAGAAPRSSASFASWLTAREVWVLAGILLVGVALRLYGLGDAWLNPDEGIYYSMTAWRDLEPFWTEVRGNAHPPLYYLMLRGLSGLTPDFWFYRLLSVVSGVFAIASAWWLARALFVPRTPDARGRERAVAGALVAAAILAVAPGQILISQVIRPYAFLLWMIGLSLAGLVLWLRRGDLASLVIHVVATCGALLTHYSAFLIAPAILWLLVHAIARGELKPRRAVVFAVSQVVPLVIVGLLYVYHLRDQLVGSELESQAFSKDGWLTPFLIDAWTQVWSHTQGVIGYLVGLDAEPVAVGLAFAGLVLFLKHSNVRTFGLVLAVWVTAVGLAATGKYPFGASRHSSWVVPCLVLPMAYAAGTLLTQKRAVAGVATVGLGLIAVFAGRPIGRVMTLGEPMLEIAREDPIPRSSVAEFSTVVREFEAKKGFLLTDMQSYYTLLPLYTRSRERQIMSEDQEWARFQWGRTEVDVAWRWQLAVTDAYRGTAWHIERLVERRDNAVPDGPRLADQEEVWVLWAGWPSPSPTLLAGKDSELPEDAKLIRAAFKVQGITAYRFRLKAFLKAIGKKD